MIFRRSIGWAVVGWVFVVVAILGVATLIVALVQAEKRQQAKQREAEKVLESKPKLVPRCPAGFLVHDGSYGYGNKPICLPGVMPTMESQP